MSGTRRRAPPPLRTDTLVSQFYSQKPIIILLPQDCLKYAHENGCDWSAATAAFIAKSGNLEQLQYAHENGCEWDAMTCAYAAEQGNLGETLRLIILSI